MLKQYTAHLEYVENTTEELENIIPAKLHEFDVNAENLENAIEIVKMRLADYILGGPNEAETFSWLGDYVELSFGDGHTGQQVRYVIEETI